MDGRRKDSCVVQVRGGNWSPTAKGWGRTGAVSLAEAIASFLSASLAELDPEGNKIEVGGGRALAQTLRINATVRRSRLPTISWERAEG
jgi:hypothetical protein